jgi:hypothetical protein
MFDITKIATMTAAEMIEQSRRVATLGLSYVPNVEVKDALAQAINLQCNLADIYASGFDKITAEVQKNWKIAA